MKAMDANLRNEMIRWQEKLFSRSIRRRVRLRKIQEMLGVTSSQTCLEITAGDGIISARLHENGGDWTTLVTGPEAQTPLEYFLDEEVGVLQGSTIDAPDQSYDAVILIDALDRIRDDYAFIKECHRVLRPDGRLVISTARKMLFCFGGCPLRSLLGLSWKARDLERPGYTSHEFFDVLKDGFDVPETVSYSSCCVEMPGLLCEAIANKLLRGPYTLPGEQTGTEEFYHYTKLYALGSLVYPLMWLLSKLDELLLFVLPGHNIAAKTKRRVWRERRTPFLLDGRSIAGEDRARGARYNSALRFTADHHNIMVVVVSADRPVSIIMEGVEVSAQCQWNPVSTCLFQPLPLELWITNGDS